MIRTSKRFITLLALAAAVFALPVAHAQASQSTISAGHHSSTATKSGTVVPNDVVTCTVQSGVPVALSGTNGIQGSGRMIACIPHNPSVCRTQAILEEYVESEGYWVDAAEGSVNYNCPPAGTSSTATYKCAPGAGATEYKTVMLETIVEDADTSVETFDSSIATFRCA